MQIFRLVGKVGPVDAKLIRRDSFLVFMFLFALSIAVILRFLLPLAERLLAENGVLPNASFPVTLAAFYPMIVAYMVLYTGALMVGTIFGFALLDEKDDDTLTAMLVTPVPPRQYALYRAGLPAVLAFVVILVMLLIVNQALLPLWQLALLAAGGACAAPIITLFFAIVAENKVQGFAYSKFTGVAGWTIILGWFAPEPLQWLLGLFPPFLVSKAYWLALDANITWLPVLLLGVILQLGLTAWLLRRFGRVVYRA